MILCYVVPLTCHVCFAVMLFLDLRLQTISLGSRALDWEIRANCCKELANKPGLVSVKNYVAVPYEITQWSKKTFVRFAAVVSAVGIAPVSLEYRSMITLTCMFPFALHDREPQMLMATMFNSPNNGTPVVEVLVYSVCFLSSRFCKCLRLRKCRGSYEASKSFTSENHTCVNVCRVRRWRIVGDIRYFLSEELRNHGWNRSVDRGAANQKSVFMEAEFRVWVSDPGKYDLAEGVKVSFSQKFLSSWWFRAFIMHHWWNSCNYHRLV